MKFGGFFWKKSSAYNEKAELVVLPNPLSVVIKSKQFTGCFVLNKTMRTFPVIDSMIL
jgi:hypothetical protein